MYSKKLVSVRRHILDPNEEYSYSPSIQNILKLVQIQMPSNSINYINENNVNSGITARDIRSENGAGHSCRS